MPKKDTKGTVLAMLSTAGAQRRPPAAPADRATAGTREPRTKRESTPTPPELVEERRAVPETPEQARATRRDEEPIEAIAQPSEDNVAAVPEQAEPVEASSPTPGAVQDPAPAQRETSPSTPQAQVSTQERPARRSIRARDANLAATRAAGNAARTIRLDQHVANRLRAAWLEAKRSDVLLTQQDFATRIISRGFSVKPRATRPPVEEAADLPTAPRTLRIDQDSANRLRAAWLEAKRSDVLLTHQEYVSRLIERGLDAELRARRG